MTKKILFIVLLASIQFIYSAAAQDSKQPVQFVFSAAKLSDTSATLIVKAKALNGTRIFTTVKKNSDDVFVSALQLDSTVTADATIKEIGVACAVALPGMTDKGTAYDSVTFAYTVFFKPGAAAIKGTFNWLGVKSLWLNVNNGSLQIVWCIIAIVPTTLSPTLNTAYDTSSK